MKLNGAAGVALVGCVWRDLAIKGLYRLLKEHEFKDLMSVEYDASPDQLASMARTRYHLDTELRPIYD
ncbi:MAG: hypothetical protein ACKVOL_06125 [Novosphingobium sp.]